MPTAELPEGIQKWPLQNWTNGHQNFTHQFTKDASFKLTLPDSLTSSTQKYKATTANFMWLINYAIANKIQLRAMGNGWSFSEVAVSEGGVVDTKSLRLSFALANSFVAPQYLNTGKKSSDLFFVQCGMSMLQLSEKLEAAGRSLKASGASNGQSIAGATATGTHGAAFKVGAVHDTVLGLHIITGANKQVWIEKASNPVASGEFIDWLGAEKISNDDVFNAAIVSFGSFGFVHGVLLETEPIFLLEEHKTSEVTYNELLTRALNKFDFSGLENILPLSSTVTPGKDFYHFEVLINPHDFAPNDPTKGVYLKAMYKIPYVSNYTRRIRENKGFLYGDNTLGLVQTILDTLGPTLSAPLVPRLVNALLPLVFKPGPPLFGTVGETFNNTRFRGKAASAAIGLNAADASRVLEEIIAINKSNPFPGAIAFRYVKGTSALLGFTKFPLTCVLEMDGVDAAASRTFIQKVWDRLQALNIPFTEHWGKFNFNLNGPLVRKMYGNAAVDTWLNCRRQLLDDETRTVFNNAFLSKIGLDKQAVV
ncbi:MAG: FAD-binding protein [Chitinophagaceae bacterium]